MPTTRVIEVRDLAAQLRETLGKLMQDPSMIAYLLTGLQAAIEQSASPAELDRHLEGISAIMESHFRYEERSLLAILSRPCI